LSGAISGKYLPNPILHPPSVKSIHHETSAIIRAYSAYVSGPNTLGIIKEEQVAKIIPAGLIPRFHLIAERILLIASLLINDPL